MSAQPLPESFPEPYNLEEKLSILKRWGRSTHSFLTLYDDVEHFRVPGVDGYISIAFAGRLILISAEPVGSAHAVKTLITTLKRFADANDYTIAALPTSELARELLASSGFGSIYIGKEPIFDLAARSKVSKSIRQAAERAKRKGLKVVHYDESFRMQVELLCRKWQAKGELPPMQFLFQLRPLDLKSYKKLFLVVDEDNVLKAFLACSPIYARKGWYLEDLIRDPSAPNGSTELLITETLKTLADEGYDMASLALAPLAGLPDRDANHPFVNNIFRLCYKYLSFVYHFQTLEYFKGKFHPSHWEKNYCCYYSKEPVLIVVGHILRAFLPQQLPDIIKHKIERWKKLS